MKNTVTVITGASSGIGAATAEKIAEAGGKVVLVARDEKKLLSLVDKIKKEGGEAYFQVADVSELEDMKRVSDYCKAEVGKVNNLVNNAGLMLFSYWKDAVVEDWNKMIDTNIKGYLHSIAAFLPDLIDQKSGHILNMSSVAGIHTGDASGVYSATKFFIRGMTESLRKEVGTQYNIQVSMVSPGVIDTGWADKIENKAGSELAKELNKGAIKPDVIANAVVFALSQPNGVAVNDIVVSPTGQNW
ncbi:short-chain dehydrogenase [Chryseobacterium shigense]|uniref:NADP-dependent 3-hydroxy acid dehydrogenase YdfG n=1 Tax=Chryseobacterium shigense TaxID=297244 RepID=A0A1N7I877_9FLAO|nr:SDR family oxidoreductase [Chryseobacterium shigense]PQA96989.1 short-chain dehydrogenase [Chryseobacterium shigense]SIS33296.1 NADP-dependent 3-hydroxy acid dehydrogenase YdfG [Chryseobacterium shigense]